MAIIPLKQRVSVRKLIERDDNGWKEEVFDEPETYKCRVTETEEIVTNQLGEERKATAKLYFNKFVDIKYSDEITYVNEHGDTIVRNPIYIRPIRLISGKPTLTRLYL